MLSQTPGYSPETHRSGSLRSPTSRSAQGPISANIQTKELGTQPTHSALFVNSMKGKSNFQKKHSESNFAQLPNFCVALPKH